MAGSDRKIRRPGGVRRLGPYASSFSRREVHRIRAPIQGAQDSGWHYIERIEVKSLEQHNKDLAGPAGVQLREELYGKFLDRSKNVYFASDEIE